jgi:hypothetical protein
MLLVFAFSITPKLVLHKLVAHHKDATSTSNKHSDQITKNGFHCDIENQVVVVPYVFQVIRLHLKVPTSFQIYQNRANYSFYSSRRFTFGLRGPPRFV